jgi:hypothetical protein
MWALMLILVAAPGCRIGDVFQVDGDTISREGVRKLTRIESLTGLEHSEVTASLTALERRSMIAIANRLGLQITEAEAAGRLQSHLENIGKRDIIRRVYQVVGAQQYLRWVVQPKNAETDLKRYYHNEITADGRKRAEAVLRQILRGDVSIRELRTRESPDLIYARFRLSPSELIHHYGKGQVDDYLERREAYESGRSEIKPAPLFSAVEAIEGLGYGNVGYVRQVADTLVPVKDGEWSRQVIRDQHQWMILRRLSGRNDLFEAEGFRLPIIEFNDWIVSRYRDLEYKICSPKLVQAARRIAPTNTFVELFK